MSDWLDLVRAANPVPRPQPLDADVQERMKASILAHDPGGESARGPFARMARKVPRLRLFVVVGGLLLSRAGQRRPWACSAVSLSAPPTGRFTGTTGSGGAAATGYSVSVTPNLERGKHRLVSIRPRLFLSRDRPAV